MHQPNLFFLFPISIVRLPGSINDNVDEDPTGTKSLWDRGLLNGASQKADCICVIHIGEIPLSLQKGKKKQGLIFLFMRPQMWGNSFEKRPLWGRVFS